MKKRKIQKKCPACNSTRYNQLEDGTFACSRCGYVNKSKEELKQNYN